MRENNFNIPDKDHTGCSSVKTILKDIAEILERGLSFNGKFKTVHHGIRKCVAYYVGMECGHSSYRTMASIKKSKTSVCGDCTYDLTREQMYASKHNGHRKKKEFYESLLIEGAKVIDVISKRDNSGKKLYFVQFKCACGAIAEKRPADITRYYKPKSKSKPPQVACRDCGHFIGHNYGDYAPIKTLLKRLNKEVANVESEQNENN